MLRPTNKHNCRKLQQHSADPGFALQVINDIQTLDDVSERSGLLKQIEQQGWLAEFITRKSHHSKQPTVLALTLIRQRDPATIGVLTCSPVGAGDKQETPEDQLKGGCAEPTLACQETDKRTVDVSEARELDLLERLRSIQRVRDSNDAAVVISLDTEWVDEDSRVILSYQLTFIHPRSGKLYQVIAFPVSEKRLDLSVVLTWLDSNFGLRDAFDKGVVRIDHLKRWPVEKKSGRKVWANSLEDAVQAADDPDMRRELERMADPCKCCSKTKTCKKIGTERACKPQTNVRSSSRTDGLGWAYHYGADVVKENALPVIVIAHAGLGDLSAFNRSDPALGKNWMCALSEVNGGMVTLDREINACPRDLRDDRYVRPFSLTIRDSIALTPAKAKSLKALGGLCGVEKLELGAGYDKGDMLAYLRDQPVDFIDYAAVDTLIPLSFTARVFGMNSKIPVTGQSACAAVVRDSIADYLGVSVADGQFDAVFRGLRKKLHGKELMVCGSGHTRRSAFRDSSSLEATSTLADEIQRLAADSYHGGWNTCVNPGVISGELSVDVDLVQAYCCAMACVPDVDWTADALVAKRFDPGDEIRLADFNIDGVSTPMVPLFADVSFEFPANVLFPSLPVDIEDVFVYPRTSGDGDKVCCAAGPEIYLALKLGATVRIAPGGAGFKLGVLKRDGEISYSLAYALKSLAQDRTTAANDGSKLGRLLDAVLKSWINSIYGKIAQGINRRSSYCARTDEYHEVGTSIITDPVRAALITSVVRAVLLALANECVIRGWHLDSVTTDGGIVRCDAGKPDDKKSAVDGVVRTINDLTLFGFKDELLRGYSRLGTIGQLPFRDKHYQTNLLNPTTRLNVGEETTGVLAHGGAKTGELKDSLEDRQVLVDGYFNLPKYGPCKGRFQFSSTEFPVWRHFIKGDEDFAVATVDKAVSLNFDFKRKPNINTLREIEASFYGHEYQASYLETVPFETPEEAERFRRALKRWKERGLTTITETDWLLFSEVGIDEAVKKVLENP